MAGQHTAEEEEHLRTLTWLAYLEKQTHGSTMVKRMGKGRLHRKKKARAEMGEGIQHGERARTEVTVSFYIQL